MSNEKIAKPRIFSSISTLTRVYATEVAIGRLKRRRRKIVGSLRHPSTGQATMLSHLTIEVNLHGVSFRHVRNTCHLKVNCDASSDSGTTAHFPSRTYPVFQRSITTEIHGRGIH
jgi:hypothetical protein